MCTKIEKYSLFDIIKIITSRSWNSNIAEEYNLQTTGIEFSKR